MKTRRTIKHLSGICFITFLIIPVFVYAQIPSKIPDALTVIHSRKSVRTYLEKSWQGFIDSVENTEVKNSYLKVYNTAKRSE